MNYEKAQIEKKNDLISRAKDIVKQAETEERMLSEEEAKEISNIKDELKVITERLNVLGEISEMEEKEVKQDNTPVENEVNKMSENEQREIKETKAFENFIRGYAVHERAGELTPAAGSGEALIPTTIANRIIKKVYDVCPILEKSSKYNVKGTLELPYYDTETSTINVAYQTEFTGMSSSNGAFKSISLTGYLAGALSKISRSLINNAQFDIVSFVVDEMAYSISRFIEKELLIGTEGKVTGLSTLTNKLITDSATAITADELIKLKDKVKDEFQNGAIWIMSPATRTALRLLTDNSGRYLLQDDITAPFGSVLLGKPVYVTDNMPDIAAGKSVVYYGDMRGLATKFNENINIEVLREKYADEHAVGVIGWFEFDSKVEDAQKISVLSMKSSS